MITSSIISMLSLPRSNGTAPPQGPGQAQEPRLAHNAFQVTLLPCVHSFAIFNYSKDKTRGPTSLIWRERSPQYCNPATLVPVVVFNCLAPDTQRGAHKLQSLPSPPLSSQCFMNITHIALTQGCPSSPPGKQNNPSDHIIPSDHIR